MLSALGTWAERTARASNPWVGAYALARTLLAGICAATLLANPISILFHPAVGMASAPLCDGVRAATAFCAVGPAQLDLTRVVAGLVMLVVASGYRPRITGIAHAWIAWSLAVTSPVLDGGDQLGSTFALLLLPMTLLDGRVWQWETPAEAREESPLSTYELARRIVAHACLALVRLQVAGVYFHASVGKFGIEEWSDGTALYYWFTHPVFGAPTWLAPLVRPILLNPVSVALLTWGVIVLELFLAAGLVMSPAARKRVLVLGIALHLGIVVLHGLASFGITMVAALLLYLWPAGEPLPSPRPLLARARARMLALHAAVARAQP